MNIRRAEKKDTGKILKLLGEVLEIHSKIRPDIFISGTTKYTENQLAEKFNDDKKPVLLQQTTTMKFWGMFSAYF